MDTRNSAMVAGLYLAGVVVIVGASLAYYTYERSRVGPPAVLDVLDLKDSRGVKPQPGQQASAPYYHATHAKANQTLHELQSSLAVSRDVLEKRTAALNQKNAECQSLKAELDQSFMLILNLLADESSDTSAISESTKLAKSKLEAELAQLIESLNQSEVLGAEQERQLAKLRADLLRTDLELAVVQEQSELELAALLTEKKAFEAAVNEVVARCGPGAVPALVDRLADERLEVRRWAAKALGAIGPEAQEGTAALRRLLSDPDSTVREEAQRALTSISGAGID